MVITKDGKPRGILLPTSEVTLVEDLQDQIRARARRAVSEVRRQAVRRGTDKLAVRKSMLRLRPHARTGVAAGEDCAELGARYERSRFRLAERARIPGPLARRNSRWRAADHFR